MWILLLLLSISTSWALPVLNFIKPDSSFTQITTLDACTTYLGPADIAHCNPALFPYQKDEGLRMGLATITDGESVEVGQKLLLDPIKEEFLRKIFSKQSFNSWGANSFIELRTSKFYVAYDPLLINADVFVFNPASPEVGMSLIKSNRLRLSTGLLVADNDNFKLSLGSKVYYYRNQYYQDSFFLSDLAGQDVDKIIKFRKQNGVSGDLGAFLKFQNAYLPKISFLVKNLDSPFHPKHRDIIAENKLRPVLTYETYSRIGLGYEFRGSWGVINSELSLPFDRVYESYYSEYTSLSLGYSLSRFSTQLALSKYQQVFGFDFGSKLASMGIFYGRSRPLGDFSNQVENVGGIRAQVNL